MVRCYANLLTEKGAKENGGCIREGVERKQEREWGAGQEVAVVSGFWLLQVVPHSKATAKVFPPW